MEETKKCPKCGGEMEQGVHLGILGIISNWGKKVSAPLGGYAVKDRKQIIAYRCKNCGYVESYAK